MALAPRTVQNIPNLLRRKATTVLHPASMTPEPTNSRYSSVRDDLHCTSQNEWTLEERDTSEKLLTFAFCSPTVQGGRGNGKRVASAPLPSGSPEPDAAR